MNSPSQLLGLFIDGRFKICSALGQGGMGTVYLAEQSELNRQVVIKVLSFALSGSAEFVERFQREARILANLEHLNLVQVYAFGLLAGEVPYLAMEHIDGVSLFDELAKKKRLSWQRAFNIGMQICDAMAAAHSKGILHRDLKPSNVMLLAGSSTEIVKVIDFGLGCFLGSDSRTLTKDGTLLGSPQYMSPEMCSGEKSDAQSDIYSLACLLYECISGVRPFSADNPIALLHQHRNEIAKLISTEFPELQLPYPKLDAIIFKGLEKSPDKRYASMAEFKEALASLLNGNPLGFEPLSVTGLSKPAGENRSQPQLKILFQCLTLTVLIVIAYYAYSIFGAYSVRKIAETGSALSMLQDSAQHQKIALTAYKAGQISKAKEETYKSLRLLTKELTSKRNSGQLLSQELQVIDQFKHLGQLLPAGNDRHRFVDLMPLIDREEGAKHYHNLAELLLLGGKCREFLPAYYPALDSYLQASRAFARAGEYDMAEHAMKTGRDLTIKEPGSNAPPLVRARLELAQAANLLAQGKRDASLVLIEQVQNEYPWATEARIQKAAIASLLGELLQESGEKSSAKKFYFKSIDTLAYQFGKAPTEYVNDGAYKRSWQGIADIAESEKDYKLAVEAYEKLAEHARAHSDYPAWTEADSRLEKLKAKAKG